MKTITVTEAIKALADGKSIISDWDKRPAKIVGDRIEYLDGATPDLNNLLKAQRLRVYEEPKNQIEVALYIYFNGEKWGISGHYYKDDLDFEAVVQHTRLYKRLDGTNGTQDTTIIVDDY